MARIVQGIGSESASDDDEFPSVQELVATRGEGKRAQASKSSRVRVGDDEKRETRVRSPMKKKLRKEEVMKVVEEAREGEVPKAKARKRVLNQRSDNPLLRPFDCASSELLGEGSRRKGKVLGVKSGKAVVKKVDEVPLEESHNEVKGRKERRDEDVKEDQTIEPSGGNVMKSIETDYDSVSQARRKKNQRRTEKSKQVRQATEEETSEDKVSETTLPAVMKSIESEDEDTNQARKTARGKIVRKAAEKTRATPPLKVESEEEDFGLDSDGLSDFIADDSTFLEEEDTVIEEPAPRSVRRLVKGRNPNRVQVSDDEGLDLRMGKLKVEDDASSTLDKALKELNLEDSDDEDLLETKTKKCPKDIRFKIPREPKNVEAAPASSDFEDPFTLR
jgi:hypothetical protein